MNETYGKLDVEIRNNIGKGHARKLRSSGKVPAVLYGQGKPNVLLAIEPKSLRAAMDPQRKLNTVFRLTAQDSNADLQSVACVVVDVQSDPIRDGVTHLDFLRIDVDKDVMMSVPVEYVGRPIGVAMGGKLLTFRRVIKVSAKPDSMPAKITVDVSGLDGSQPLRASAISLENARVLEADHTIVAVIDMPRGQRASTTDSADTAKA